MTPLFKKMNYKPELGDLLILGAPENFTAEIDALLASDHQIAVQQTWADDVQVQFALGFAVTIAQLNELSAQLAAATEGDALVWLAYPKKSSKQYKGEFNRDSAGGPLGTAGFEPVRQVAIDQDWSVLRFRRVAYIKTMKRRNSMAVSQAGKERTKEN